MDVITFVLGFIGGIIAFLVGYILISPDTEIIEQLCADLADNELVIDRLKKQIDALKMQIEELNDDRK